jgi:two-component system NarL family sensor kinase
MPKSGKLFRLMNEVLPLFLHQPVAVTSSADPHSPIPERDRSYLLGLGFKTILIIPLVSGGRVNGRLTFHFVQERDFHPEELGMARALGTQASLAIHLIRLAQAARQSAVLEERNRLAGEIHDSLAQSFAGITMQLAVAEEEIAAGKGTALCRVRLADEMAEFGLAEARRSALSLRPAVIEESGLVEALRMLVKHSNVPGRLHCDLQSNKIPEEKLMPQEQHELLRIAQEAISNAVRHAKPTVIAVTLRWDQPNLLLHVKDNGCGIAKARLQKSMGFGLGNMRARVSKIGGELEIKTATGRGTSIIVTVPIAS